jgi:hypothetical protein
VREGQGVGDIAREVCNKGKTVKVGDARKWEACHVVVSICLCVGRLEGEGRCP